MRPGPEAVRIAQDRRLEKSFLRDLDLPVAPFVVLDAGSPVPALVDDFSFPALLKTARWGYDGKGQETVARAEDLARAWQALAGVDAVLEARLALVAEFSILLARGEDGMVVFYPAARNYHRDGILDVTLVSPAAPTTLELEARHMALRIAEALDYIGVLAVDFFVDDRGQVLVNELAPRPHNSGHFSLDASLQSQFDQQLRCLCGLPLGDTRLLSPVAMMNLLGDLWIPGEPDWAGVLEHPQVKLWLYGKAQARARRKMGHLTILPENLDAAAATLAALRRHLSLPELPPLGSVP
jgi:5-(carboxyamino)imidazole ribonucleotide synthase